MENQASAKAVVRVMVPYFAGIVTAVGVVAAYHKYMMGPSSVATTTTTTASPSASTPSAAAKTPTPTAVAAAKPPTGTPVQKKSTPTHSPTPSAQHPTSSSPRGSHERKQPVNVTFPDEDKYSDFNPALSAKIQKNLEFYGFPGVPADPRERALFNRMLRFAAKENDEQCLFRGLTSDERKAVHDLAEVFGLNHRSITVDTPQGRTKIVAVERGAPKKRAPKKIFSYSSTASPRMTQNQQQAPPRSSASPKTVSAFVASPSPRMEGHYETDDERRIYRTIQDFVISNEHVYNFPIGMSAEQRGIIHKIAEDFELDHVAMGKQNKFIRVTKVSAEVLDHRREQAEQVHMAIEQYRAELKEKEAHVEGESPTVPKPAHAPMDEGVVKSPRTLRYMNWNIEWMDFLFASDTEFRTSTTDIPDVSALCESIAGVIMDLEPDIIAIEEGPATKEKMDLFIDTYLNGWFECIGVLEEKNQQQLFFLINKRSSIVDIKVNHDLQKYFESDWLFDVSGDCTLESYHFTRKPLAAIATLKTPAGTVPLFLCCAHTKSKYINGGFRKWEAPEEKNDFIKKAVTNRRRITAECHRIRKGLDNIIYAKNENPLVIVSGDLNDGPGMDFFEEFYLLADSVQQLLGSSFQKKMMLQSLLVRSKWVHPLQQWTVEFDDFIDGVKAKRCLLDHVCVSHKLAHHVSRASVAHQVFNRHVLGPGPERGNRPSDHRPVFIDISLDSLHGITPL